MLKIYDKAQWHIDAGMDTETVVERMKILFDFLDSKGLLDIEGKEIKNLGIDSSISLHERMLTEEGRQFLDQYYDSVISRETRKIEAALHEAYKAYTNHA
ncbi:MAG: hypothetical protein NC123_04090 [Butyrivibrio sp.]|nr:hypothetical protein [Acetatifactor muris]MCM1558710.1 hypothetical protein [Butyrivibrio sp.]